MVGASSLRFIFLFFLFFFLFFPLHSQPTEKDQKFDTEFIPNLLPAPNKAKYEEQISCDNTCTKFTFDGKTEITDKVWAELKKNGGKVVIEISSPKVKIDDPILEDYVEFLREISKREGNVSFEPYYIGYRGLGLMDVPMFKDIFGISYNIYKRLRSFFFFSRMGNYHAKVLYHPTSNDILLIYFFHKNYGSLCDTVYSTCETIQYVNDDLFDLQLSKTLEKASKNNVPIEIKFDQVGAELPQAKLDLDSLLSANKSTRLYKWLIAAKKTEMKKIQRERFIDLNLIVTILDYSLKAYELIEAIQLYWPIRSMKSEVIYEDRETGKILQSVIFTNTK